MRMDKPAPKVIMETILATGMTPTEAADYFNVSTRWIRTLTQRYNTGGIDALTPRSTRPHANSRATDPTTVARIIELRHELTERGTDAGAHTIRWHLEQEETQPLPATSTIHRILDHHGLITPQPQKRPRSSWIRFQADQPNETWQLDYTDWALADNTRVVILTILDDHSRFIIACRAYPQATVTNVITCFSLAVSTYGPPQSTLTDNGRAFTTNNGRSTNTPNGFEQLLVELGIHKKNGKPYHPQTQGKVERYHHTLKLALSNKPPAETIDELNTHLDDITDYYNHHRPHRALNRMTPAQAYDATPKARPDGTETHANYRIRTDKVGKTGKVTLRWKGKLRRLYIGNRHAGEPIVLLCVHTTVTIRNPSTGKNLAAYELDPELIYYGQTRNLLNPKHHTGEK